MTHDEPLPPSMEQLALRIAHDDDRWVQRRELVSWDVVELLLVSGLSEADVARQLGVDRSTVQRRRRRKFWPMDTDEVRVWLAVVLGRAVMLRRYGTAEERCARDDPAALLAGPAYAMLAPPPTCEGVRAVRRSGDAAACERTPVEDMLPVSRAVGVVARGSTDGPSGLLTMSDPEGAAPWSEIAHPAQLAPEGAWRTWLLMGGRGAGKTRAGAEWVRALVEAGLAKRIALVGPTLHDVREVMIAGPSGLCAIGDEAMRPKYEVTRRRLVWPPVGACAGAVAFAFSAEDPQSLRGPQFDLAWCDEIGAWAKDLETWNTLAFAMRLGQAPRIVATTTPRPRALVKLLAEKAERNGGGVTVTRANTRANAVNLSPDFVAALEEDYAGTELGRQELDGELIEDLEGAMWSREMIETTRASFAEAEGLQRIVVAVDPPAGASERSDACGIIVAGVKDGVVYVLADATARGLKPAGWAERVMQTAATWGAALVVAEGNQGGEMVRDVLNRADGNGPRVKLRHAHMSKERRAAPVSTLYAKGRVRHVRVLKELEDEMCAFGVVGAEGRRARSPDRVDALVWAVDELIAKRPRSRPRLDAF